MRSEQFVDEVAAALKMAPIEFRLAYLDPAAAGRDINIIQQVREQSGWASRPAPSPSNNSGAEIVSGRGFAYQPRGGSYVATVAEVTVNRKTGQVRVTKLPAGRIAGWWCTRRTSSTSSRGQPDAVDEPGTSRGRRFRTPSA